ncbi:MAG: hypothetical protein JW892_02100, partial [Anaerolineae bacterium]|nr:hypothetical protein [Anaerolineae bacterium]
LPHARQPGGLHLHIHPRLAAYFPMHGQPGGQPPIQVRPTCAHPPSCRLLPHARQPGGLHLRIHPRLAAYFPMHGQLGEQPPIQVRPTCTPLLISP